jgi:hypothetical protein
MSDQLQEVPAPAPAAAPEPSPRDQFIAMLPDELRGEGVFASLNNVGDLAKSYLNAAKMVGLDKNMVLPIPRDDSKEAWDAVYAKLGRPESPDKYNLEAYKDMTTPEAIKPWAEKLHSLGLNQRQVDGILGDFFGSAKSAQEAQANEMKARFEQWGEQIKAEYGLATERKLDAAVNIVEKTLGDEGLKFIEENPQVFRDPRMVRFLVSMADKTGEGSVLLPGGQRAEGPISPADAKQQLNALQADPNYQKAIWNKSHPQHQHYVDLQSKLWEYAAPGDR